jgi:DNA ligase (NAD+)
MEINAAEATIDLLYRKGMVRDVADLYALHMASVQNLERFGEKSAMNLIESIELSKSVPFPRVLYALGIRHVGETVARKLAEAFLSLDNLMEASQQALEEVDEIGGKIAESLKSYFQDERNLQLLDRLKTAGLQLEMEAPGETLSALLAGKTLVISGVFIHHSRDQLKGMIEQHGGKNSGSISSKTDYILAGENMGPSKYEKAQKLGVPIISEEDFMEMLSQ